MSKTFKAYVDIRSDKEKAEDEELSKSAGAVFEAKLEPTLLPGELVIAHCQNVLKFSAFSEQKQGMSGSLFCTNFKVTFVTADRSSYDDHKGSQKKQRNLLLGENDIALACIDSVFQISKEGKRKRLSPGSKVSGRVKTLEIRCKNFSTHTFSFKFSPRTEDKSVVNAILHHAFPIKLNLLFAFETSRRRNSDKKSRRSSGGDEKLWRSSGSDDRQSDDRRRGSEKRSSLRHDIVMYLKPSDWEAELNRLCCASDWRVAMFNESFNHTQNFPEYFVVPKTVLNNELIDAIPHFVDGRVPVWCYTYDGKASLIRMAYIRPDTAHPEHENKMLEKIRMSHPNKRQARVFDLGRLCPSVKEIDANYKSLKELCMPVTVKDLTGLEDEWFSHLDNTKWLQTVSACLQVAVDVANTMAEGTSVVIKEYDSRDLCCVISSLVQVMLDPHYRSLQGFQMLIQREWVMMCHKFLSRLGYLRKQEDEQSPIFLVFLDCMWQLLQQFPSCFAFSETYLTTLWDSCHYGMFETFLFNSPHSKYITLREGDPETGNRSSLYSVWSWGYQFDQEEKSLFNNPLYKAEKELIHGLNGPKVSNTVNGAQSSSSLSYDSYVKLLNAQQVQKTDFTMLTPVVSGPYIKLWEQCFLRWLVPIQIIGGGSPSEYFQQCVLVEEIMQLKNKLDSLDSGTPGNRASRLSSDLYFSFEENGASKYKGEVLTSSFPFSPVGPLNRQSVAGTCLSHFVEQSSIGVNGSNNGDDVDEEDDIDEMTSQMAENVTIPSPDPKQQNPFKFK